MSDRNSKFFDKLQEIQSKGRSNRFIKLPEVKICRDPSHNPPTHLCIPEGMAYEHVCQGCGNTTLLHSPRISYSTMME